MAAVNDTQGGGFSFIWTIRNFSYCWQQNNQTFWSPFFVLKAYDDIEWYLTLREKNGSETVGLQLWRLLRSGFRREDIGFELSIRTTTGIFIKERDQKQVFSPSNEENFDYFLQRKDLYEKRLDAYLNNDSLTIKCRIFKVKDQIIPSGRCHARTTIDVDRSTCVCRVENFAELGNGAKKQKLFSVLTNQDRFTMDLVFTIGKIEHDKIEIEIRHEENIKNCFFSTCKVALLGVAGEIVHTASGEFWFNNTQTEQIWKVPIISTNKILSSKERYLQIGALCLRCEFAISSGLGRCDEVEVIEYETADFNQQEHLNKEKDSSFVGSLKDNLQLFYTNEKFSDLVIRTAGKDFPVHKTILCARSEVFTAMFERDMKENKTGIIAIEDIEEDIVSKMLLFVYTDTVGEDLEWGTASSLYFAADK